MRQCLHLWPYLAVAGVTLIALTLDRARPRTEVTSAGATPELPRLDAAEDLERRAMACQALSRARRRVVHELVDGRITLLEAAERFRDLSETSLDFHYDQFRMRFPGPSDDVRHCQHVIGFTQEVLHQESRPATEVSGRLQKELDELVQRGSVRLSP